MRTGGREPPLFSMSRIAEINGEFRVAVLTEPQKNGRCILTQGVHRLDPDVKMSILQKVKAFDTFTEDNDPYREHDFGTIEMMGVGKVFWKIDYYADENVDAGAEDIENAYRVLIIMLAEDY